MPIHQGLSNQGNELGQSSLTLILFILKTKRVFRSKIISNLTNDGFLRAKFFLEQLLEPATF